MENSKYIDSIRTLGILFVVVFHTYIICFSNSEVLVYLSPFAAMMPLITFISGYLFRMLYNEGHYKSFKMFVIKKAKRLLIPMFAFSFLYINYKSLNLKTIDLVLNGVGPLWFLIMLFWNFLFAFLFYNCIDMISDKRKYTILMMLSLLFFFILIYIPLPEHFGINAFSNYLFYFILGGVISENRDIIYKYTNKEMSLFLLILFIPLYMVCMHVIPMNHVGKVIGGNMIRLSVLLVLPLFCYYFQSHINVFLKPINKFSFGIYLIHSFILLILNNNFPLIIHNPLFVFLIAFAISYLITKLSIKTQIGEFLMK